MPGGADGERGIREVEGFKKLVRKNEQVYLLFRYAKRIVFFGPKRATAFRKAEKARKEKNQRKGTQHDPGHFDIALELACYITE